LDMRHLTRFGAGLATLAALLALITGTALAGGWAEVVMTGASEDPPVAGETDEIQFTLLQHGVTAVDFGDVNLTAVNTETGQELTAPATSLGGGRWSARVTFPVAGSWQIGVRHNELETSGPTTLTVGPVDQLAWLPPMLTLGIFAAVALALVGGMLLFRNRPVVAGRPIRTGG
ncbi:MAG TPA: hypothetical protein VIL21_00935, partial [Solirubrobacterales bacterium]